MSINKTRERRRKKLAKLEIDKMIERYPEECGEVIVRPMTVKELEKYYQEEQPQNLDEKEVLDD